MANVFKKYQNFVKKPNRNSFDLSFTNNFTTDFGRLTPVFCKEVLPGDSVRIDPTFGLNFAPMMYPVQTKMKAHLHFFYVRNRTLWRDWMDFIGNTKDGLIPPYIDFDANPHLLKSGSLADYLGLPTTLVKPTGASYFSFNLQTPNRPNNKCTSRVVIDDFRPNGYNSFNLNTLKITTPSNTQVQKNYQYLQDALYFTQGDISEKPANYKINNNLEVQGIIYQPTKKYTASLYAVLPFYKLNDEWEYSEQVHPSYFNEFGIKSTFVPTVDMGHDEYAFEASFNMPQDFCEWLEDLQFTSQASLLGHDIKLVMLYKVDTDFEGEVQSYRITYTAGTQEFVEASDLELKPYRPGVLPISALPFRAYEAIYNSFYRNPQNNPFILDGKPEYNRYVTNIEGGQDSTFYDIYKRNWDDDAFTTAVQSPQQGIAPLVGVSASGEFTFQDDDGTYKAQAQFADDGETITGISVENRMPAGTTRALIDLVSTGISINDFRNVNALQRWLEKNMRRGFRYKDQIMSHFGSNIEYDELLMPEFIGGVSNQVDVNRIINSAETELAPLGSYGGLAQSFGGTPNTISHYCDEHGFIIGILSVVPYANYSQLMPKMFTRNSVLDYYFPEFGNIGMQAITNRDLMPLQSYANSLTQEEVSRELVQTFGYQRPWWDYISSTDEVHGRFRTDFRDYLLNRVFSNNPKLSPDFLTIDSNDLNDVFVVSDNDAPNTDKILGIIHFDFKKKTTIPEFGIPKLEVE